MNENHFKKNINYAIIRDVFHKFDKLKRKFTFLKLRLNKI